jgi:hypothetical protein
MSKPARGICKVAEYDTSVFYNVQCSCMSDKHAQTITLDIDDDVIMLSIYSTIWTHYNNRWCDTWQEKLEHFYNSQTLKWKQVFKLIFTGQVEAENEFLFQGEEQIRDYIAALEEGLEKLNSIKESK